MKSDVSNTNEASEAARNENSDWPDSAVYHKNQEKSLPYLSERQENEANFSEKTSTNGTDSEKSPKRGDDIIVPEISQIDEGNDNLSPRGGRYNLRPNPNPNYSKISDTKEKIELRLETNAALFFYFILHFFRPRGHYLLNKYGDFLSATIPFKIIQGLRNQH